MTDPDILITEEEPEKGSIGYSYSDNTEWVENSDMDVIQILSDQEIREAIIRAVKRKPARHGFGSRGESGSGAGCGDSGQRAMWRIGG